MSSPAVQVAGAEGSSANSAESSILLLTYNGEQYLPQLFQMLQRQKQLPGEVIAIDSGSTDRTTEILQSENVQVHRISKSEFSHSKTRNQAVRLASGKYAVFLTQDATPAD